MANDGKQIKLPLYSYGFPALCAFIAAIKQTADAAGSGVLQLSQGMQESLAEIEAALNDLPSAASITISTSGWVEDNEATHSYKYYYDITSEGTTADDVPILGISPSSMSIAATCGLCSTCESMAGKVRIYAISVPSTSMVATLMVLPGKSSTNDNVSEG
jgi:hypothetical protein